MAKYHRKTLLLTATYEKRPFEAAFRSNAVYLSIGRLFPPAACARYRSLLVAFQ
jgi:hypothetical protein